MSTKIFVHRRVRGFRSSFDGEAAAAEAHALRRANIAAEQRQAGERAWFKRELALERAPAHRAEVEWAAQRGRRRRWIEGLFGGFYCQFISQRNPLWEASLEQKPDLECMVCGGLPGVQVHFTKKEVLDKAKFADSEVNVLVFAVCGGCGVPTARKFVDGLIGRITQSFVCDEEAALLDYERYFAVSLLAEFWGEGWRERLKEGRV